MPALLRNIAALHRDIRARGIVGDFDEPIRVHYGGGAASGWVNFAPGLGALRRSVRRGNLVRGLPVLNGGASALSAPYLFDRLNEADLSEAMRNTWLMLCRDGVIRSMIRYDGDFDRAYLALRQKGFVDIEKRQPGDDPAFGMVEFPLLSGTPWLHSRDPYLTEDVIQARKP